MDAATQQKDVERIKGILAQIDQTPPMPRTERDNALSVLEEFECWGPFFRLIKQAIENSAERTFGDYIKLAKAQNIYLEDVFAAADTCASLVGDLKISHKAFSEEVLPQIIEEEDFAAETTLRGAVWNKFSEDKDKVDCLERLCMLYEKKTHNDSQLAETYDTLLSVDEDNVKALRYFKLVFAQNNEWDEVVKYLNRLLQVVKHKAEVYRVAQELAAIFLYQLDLPEEAIRVISTHCAESPLDTSTILFDAHHRLADWNGCLKVLRECLLGVDEDAGQAVLHFKIAGISEQLGDLDAALENYMKAATQWPEFMDAYEGVIGLLLEQKKFDSVLDWIGKLEENVRDTTLLEQLQQASKRLKEGIDSAASG
jgi:tetratricopeptide (TPR) repeat protein